MPDAVASEDRVLLVMVITGGSVLDDVLTALLDIGVPGTVVESKGLMALMREEMPVFGGLASMLGSTTGSKVILSATTVALADQVFAFLEDEMKATERPLAFTVPVAKIVGLRQ